MQQHNLQQGSEQWHAFRAEHFGASEAAAMLGLSKYTTRTELLHQKATGLSKEHSDATQAVFARGHETEALARPLVEAFIGEQLSPVTCSKGNLSCSCDGITFDDSIAWEHKQLNAALAASVARKELPEEHQPQCQQVLMITGAEKLIFTVSDGTLENMVSMEVLPDTAWFERIRAGWAQFEKDLADYVPPEVITKDEADPIMQLPAVIINATGGLSTCNLDEIKPKWDVAIAEAKTRVSTTNITNGKAIGKHSRETAKVLKLKAKEVVDQISTVSEAVRTLEFYAAEFDKIGLAYEKEVAKQEAAEEEAALNKVRAEYTDHVAGLQAEVEPIRLVIPQPDFAKALARLRDVNSKNNALSTALANARIAADAIAKDIRAKLHWFNENALSHNFLFHDLQSVIFKPMDDFKLLVETRIANHKQAEAAKEEATRLRIQQEEEAKARAKVEAEAVAKLKAEQQEEDARRLNVKIQEESEAEQARKSEHEKVMDDAVNIGTGFLEVSGDGEARHIPVANVVVMHQDAISAFLASRDFGKEAGKVRAILVEFVKFSAQFERKEAA